MGRGAPLIRQWNLLKTLQAHRFGMAADGLAGRRRVAWPRLRGHGLRSATWSRKGAWPCHPTIQR